jgi:4-amino-4-deoxy-L-arabinose transferase-like glycosyltransferase
MYAISAWEMGQTGQIVATTFLGALDYYNTKPPLNVWLIALSFKAFGVNIVALRLVSVISAWLTVAVLQGWTRRAFEPAVALFASVVLATSFGFVYVHSARTAETDALFTLLILLTVVALWAEERQPWHRLWLGPLAAAVFLLRGMAVLMPLTIILAVFIGRTRARRTRWVPTLSAVLLFVVPVGAWALARWRIDQWKFFERMFDYDFLARSLTVIEEHPGTPFYYFNIVFKHQYDWLLAGSAAFALFPALRTRLRERLKPAWDGEDGMGVLVASWAGATLFIPTVMRTKLPWYANPFYPVLALSIGWILARALKTDWSGSLDRRHALLGAVIVLALGVAEGKLLWYSFHYRDLSESTQGLLLQEGRRLRNRRVFQNQWDRAEIFVVNGVLGAERRSADRAEKFWRESQPGDCMLSRNHLSDPRLVLVRSNRHHELYCRTE